MTTESTDLRHAIGKIIQAAANDPTFRAAWQRSPAQAIKLLKLSPSTEQQLLDAVHAARIPPDQALAWLKTGGLSQNDFK